MADLRPKRLTQEQLDIVTGRLRGQTGRIIASSEAGYPNGQNMVQQLSQAFQHAGLTVDSYMLAGVTTRPAQGLIVRASNEGLGIALTSTLDAAEIVYELHVQPPTSSIELLFVQPLL